MRYSPFESRTKQQPDPDLSAQKAAFFAKGNVAEVLPPQLFAKDQAEKQTYTVIANGRPKSRGMQ